MTGGIQEPPRGEHKKEGTGSSSYYSTVDGYWSQAKSSVYDASSYVTSTVTDAASNLRERIPSLPNLELPTIFKKDGPNLTDPQSTRDSLESTVPPFESTAASVSKQNTRRPTDFWFSFKRDNPYDSNKLLLDLQYPSSMYNIRSLLTVVDSDTNTSRESSVFNSTFSGGNLTSMDHQEQRQHEDISHPLEESLASWTADYGFGKYPNKISNEETASRLAEGTLRALRDLALQEAAQLHVSLRFWTSRWERPGLSYLEAGPIVWFSSSGGYDHQQIGKKVSQIQAVLARRCGAIGELQEHLLRANWRKGVAQWGVLGQGGQWSAVAGGDGHIDDAHDNESLGDNEHFSTEHRHSDEDFDSSSGNDVGAVSSTTADEIKETTQTNSLRRISSYYGQLSLDVENSRGGRIRSDDSALAAWSVDTMRLVRDQLHKAGNGVVELPLSENWKEGQDGISSSLEASKHTLLKRPDAVRLPKWATEEQVVLSHNNTKPLAQSDIVISDLPLMATEVSSLLTAMENHMDIQRNRRLEVLKPPSFLRRNWYMAAVGFPIASYTLFKLLREGYCFKLAKAALDKMLSFYSDHVSGPMKSIYYELFTRSAHEGISDRKARMDTIESLKTMIRSWLDETYPNMDEAEKKIRANEMDMSLIEKKKAASIKTIYEINSVVWMSLIEMQFIKKELMNALYAMDDLMTSNEININLAAVTPAVLLLYTADRMFRFLFYALLKVGKSRAETYNSFRHVILDIERLLVMRDNPPSAPPPLSWGVQGGDANNNTDIFHENRTANTNQSVLNSDDLGMLMLHIHSCRTIMWENRRRFRGPVMRNVSEDLAELAGERGAVSVQQQLQILARIWNYPFLK